MADLDANGDGGIDMHTEIVENAAEALSGTGTMFSNGWNRVMAQVTAARGKVGTGPLGEAFAKQYDETASATDQDARTLPGTVQYYSNACSEAVRNYTAADRAAHRAMPS